MVLQRLCGYRYSSDGERAVMKIKTESAEEVVKEHILTPERFLNYLHSSFFGCVEKAMEDVKDELQLFGERGMNFKEHHIQSTLTNANILALPTFLADEKERETTRYVNITTIATFFSSVTATTLQMSLTYQNSNYYSSVNFFWFLSIVFSVSSGISSLVGMTWRKSSM